MYPIGLLEIYSAVCVRVCLGRAGHVVSSVPSLGTKEANSGQEEKNHERSDHFALASLSTAESEAREERAECNLRKGERRTPLASASPLGAAVTFKLWEIGRSKPPGGGVCGSGL